MINSTMNGLFMEKFFKRLYLNPKKNKCYLKLTLQVCLLCLPFETTLAAKSETAKENVTHLSNEKTNKKNNIPAASKPSEKQSQSNFNAAAKPNSNIKQDAKPKKPDTVVKPRKKEVKNTAQQRWTLNYQNTSLKEFIHQIADITGNTFILSSKLPEDKNINVIASKPMTSDEVYDVFLYTLSANEFSVIRKGEQLYQIISQPLSKSAGTHFSSESKPRNANMVIEVVSLHSVSALEIIPAVRPLLASFGHVSASTTANAVLLADLQDNVNRIKKAILDLDTAGNNDYEVIPILNARVNDISRVIHETITNSKSPLAASVHVVADERGNKLILKGNENKRVKIRELIKTLDQKGISRSSTRVIFLKHAASKNIASILSEAAQHIAAQSDSSNHSYNNNFRSQNQSKKTVFVKADETTNSILMMADPIALNELENLVFQLDIKRPQVLIEAAIVEISGNTNNNIGLQWGINGKDSTLGTQETGPGTFATEIANKAFSTAFFGNNKLDFGSYAWRFADFGFIINMISNKTNTNLLSTPTILTLDNEKAELSVGQEVPFKTGSYTNSSTGGSNPFTTTERKPVGLTLQVTPHVGDSSSMRLEIEQEISSLIPNSIAQLGTSDVVTDRRKLKATISVEDGQTIVMGGLLHDSVQKSKAHIPILGRIPGLGALFSNRKTTHEKKNLMLFIKPTILKNPTTLSDISQSKYNTLRAIRTSNQNTLPIDASNLFQFESHKPINQSNIIRSRRKARP